MARVAKIDNAVKKRFSREEKKRKEEAERQAKLQQERVETKAKIDIELVQYSEGDINAPPGSDAETLRIDAALLSQNGRVGRQHWADDKKDTIIIYGAIATNARMGFGYTDGTGFQHRVITFDAHLLDNPPPLFPTGNTYNIDLWESQ